MSDISAKNIVVIPTPSGFGAQVFGLDLSKPFTDAQKKVVEAAWADHCVLSFPNQPLSVEELERFTLQFGDFGVDPFIKPMADHPHVLELRREADEKAVNFGAAWHSDWSFQECPPAATILLSKVTPPVGGDTLFTDCYAAFESLSPAFRSWLSGLTAIHSASRPYGRSGVFAVEKEKRSMQIVTGEDAEKTFSHPVVRTNPLSGRKALFVNPVYTLGIEGLSHSESEIILNYLYAHMTQEKFVYRNKWSPDMLLIWDNRCTMHNAEGGYDGYLRVMHRTTVAGERPKYLA